MEDDIKCCRKRTCPRYKVGVYRANGSKYCSACGAKMRPFWERDNDSPPLVDDAPDHRSVTHSQRHISSGGSVMQKSDTDTKWPQPPSTPIPIPTREEWMKFKDSDNATWSSYAILIRACQLCEFALWPGNWQSYDAYLLKCGAGTLTHPNEISALIARIKAYAANHSLNWDTYNSFTGTTSEQGRARGKVVTLNQTKETFTCDDSDIAPCSQAPKACVFMPAEMYVNFIHLCRSFKTEWLAYLKGTKEVNDKGEVLWEITDFYFPPQTVTASHVDIPDDYRPEEGTIGDIHSHVDMSAFFSAEDKKHFNWPVHIVINRKGETDIALAHTLGCGKTTRLPATLYTTSSDSQDTLVKSLEEKLTLPGQRPN
jgi:proteasome lid subunit RPN8/RPN11